MSRQSCYYHLLLVLCRLLLSKWVGTEEEGKGGMVEVAMHGAKELFRSSSRLYSYNFSSLLTCLSVMLLLLFSPSFFIKSWSSTNDFLCHRHRLCKARAG
jgi:hypothetical protein